MNTENSQNHQNFISEVFDEKFRFFLDLKQKIVKIEESKCKHVQDKKSLEERLREQSIDKKNALKEEKQAYSMLVR